MSAEIPSPWSQALPRAVRLAPDGILVPAATLRVLLGKSGQLELIYTGFALEPCIADGDRIHVETLRGPERGDLALCEAGAWGDVRRILGASREGGLVTGLDALPGSRETLSPARVLGVVKGRGGAHGPVARLAALAFPFWSRCAAFRGWWRRLQEAPDFGEEAAESVRRKYGLQVEEYAAMAGQALGEEPLALVRRYVRPGGSILVAGSGTGGETLGLARAGYRVCGFDFLPAMVQRGRRNAREAGLDVEFIEADVATLDLASRRFDTVYFTPLVYSFIPGRARRIESLRRLGRHLEPGGTIIFSAHLIRSPLRLIEAGLVWMRRRLSARRSASEFGDWYTRFLTPKGSIGRSFVHLSLASDVKSEARAAGFRRVRRHGEAHFVVGDLRLERPWPAACEA